jgi:hypothetical protein
MRLVFIEKLTNILREASGELFETKPRTRTTQLSQGLFQVSLPGHAGKYTGIQAFLPARTIADEAGPLSERDGDA